MKVSMYLVNESESGVSTSCAEEPDTQAKTMAIQIDGKGRIYLPQIQ